MASTHFKKHNFNRFKKVYPFVHRERREGLISEVDTILEIGEITFNNQEEVSYTFVELFPSAPFITATPYDFNGNALAGVNVFIDRTSTASFTVKSSAAFTGRVQFHAIYIKS